MIRQTSRVGEGAHGWVGGHVVVYDMARTPWPGTDMIQARATNQKSGFGEKVRD